MLFGLSHHFALVIAYATVALIQLAIARRRPQTWPVPEPISFRRPWLEVGFVALGILGTLAMGQLWSRGWLIPRVGGGAAAQLAEAANQLAIFAPILAVPLLRRHTLRSAWLPLSRLPERLAVGAGLAAVALGLFTLTRAGVTGPGQVLGVLDPSRLHNAMQVWCEDVAIAILVVRLSAAMRGPNRVALLAGALFAAGHIPALLAGGAAPAEMTGLVVDALLGFMMVRVLIRTGDIWWFWPVHFVLDMTQFVVTSS